MSGGVRRCRAVSDGDRLGQAEDLAQIGQIGFVVAQRLARRVRDLGHGLAVGVGELHHDVDGLQPHVVGQPRADAEAQLYAVGKALVQGQGRVQVQAVGEHQALGLGVYAQLLVVGDGLLAPGIRVARVVPQPVEELGEVHVEIGQEGIHAHGVGQGNAQVAPVLLHPVLQRGNLEVAQAHALGLVALQVLVGHGAYGHDAEVARQQHVGRSLEPLRRLRGKGLDHLALPGAREAPAHAEVEQLEGIAQPGLAGQVAQALDLAGQAPAAFGQRRLGVEAPEIQLVDDGQHIDLEAHHMDLGALGLDVQGVAIGPGADEGALELEDAQKVDEVALHEAQPAQVGQVFGREAQRAQGVQLALHLGQQLGQREGRLRAADEFVFGLGLGIAVQHGLPHREFVEIGVEQAGDDGSHGAMLGKQERRLRAGGRSGPYKWSSWLEASRNPRACMAARKSWCADSKPGTGLMASCISTMRSGWGRCSTRCSTVERTQ